MQNGRRIQCLDSWLSLDGSGVGVGVGSMTEVHLHGWADFGLLLVNVLHSNLVV